MKIEIDQLLDIIRREGALDRRLFLAYAAGLSAIPLVGSRAIAQKPSVNFLADPFRLGVASGDPTSQGVVLWTRLAPQPLEPGGGMPGENVEVSWEVADDEAMGRVVARGTAVATPRLAHSVHVEVDTLRPDRWYWYRFRAGDVESPVGRTRTLPTKDSTPSELRFAFASCQRYEHGLYTAYEHMAQDELDLVFFLGDYIYEYEGQKNRVREVVGKEIVSLDDYRTRYAQYKCDRLLQAMHARAPWVVTWDDHEVDNNYANDISEEADVNPVDFLVRRAAAYQAFYEHMPLRSTSVPRGPDMQLYRKLSFGQLAEFLVLDTRQFRTDQPNGDGKRKLTQAAFSPDGTMMGARQRAWVEASLGASPAAWNVLAQQVMMGMVDIASGEKKRYGMDEWPGYMHDRQGLLNFLAARRVSNPVVLTGDNHANWVNQLRVDDRREELPIVATEFVGTSISSDGNGVETPANLPTILAENPGVKFHNRERGYVRCTVTADAWLSDYRVVEDVTQPGAVAKTRGTFVVESGRAGAERAT